LGLDLSPVLTPGKYSETSSVLAVLVFVDAVVDAFEVDSLVTCSGLVLFINVVASVGAWLGSREIDERPQQMDTDPFSS
jgi:hypothetical protein